VAGKPSLARVRNHVRVVAQSDKPVRVLTGSADPRSHKKIIPTRITKNPPTATAADGVALVDGVDGTPQKSQPRTITPTICTIVANRNPSSVS
jgi:hypothetical protein